MTSANCFKNDPNPGIGEKGTAAFVLALLALLAVNSCFAMMWIDPTFENMADQSELIAVVEVTHGGKYFCTAKIIQSLKGPAKPERIELCGFNNPFWPQSAVEREALKTGDRLLVFLSRCDGQHVERRVEHLLPSKQRWKIPTPSTGDYPIRDGEIRGGWLEVGYPVHAPGVSADLVMTLVQGYLDSRRGKTPVKAQRLLGRLLTREAVLQVTTDESEANEKRAWELQWLLCAQAAYGKPNPAVLMAARSKHELVQLGGARALRSLAESAETMSVVRHQALKDLRRRSPQKGEKR